MEFNNPYWSPKTKIETLCRWVLVHSVLYYEMNESVVSDHKFDANCNQLHDLIVAHPEEFKNSRYYHSMKDFDGSTGYGYFEKLEFELQDIVTRDASFVRDNYKKWRKEYHGVWCN